MMSEVNKDTVGIELKDQKGEPIFYNRIEAINVQGYDADGKAQKWTYRYIGWLKAYIVRNESGSDGVRVIKRLTAIGDNNIWFTGISDKEVQENGYQTNDGNYNVMIIITQRNLIEGEFYTDL